MSDRACEHLMRHYAGFIPCGGLREVTPSPAASSPASDTRPAIRTEYAVRPCFADESEEVGLKSDIIAKLVAGEKLPVRRLRDEFREAQNGSDAGDTKDQPGSLFRKCAEFRDQEGLYAFLSDASAPYSRTQAEADVETALRSTPDFALGFHPDDELTLTPREQREQVREEILILGVIGFISSLVLAAGALGLMAVFGWGF